MRKNDSFQSISELTSIITSRAYREVLEERRNWLQKEANNFIRQQKWTEAFGAVMRMDDLAKTLEMLQRKLDEIKREK
jgi:hypothetical protein